MNIPPLFRKSVLCLLLSLFPPFLTGCDVNVTSFTIDGLKIVTSDDTGEFNPPQPISVPVFIVYSIAWENNPFAPPHEPTITMRSIAPDGTVIPGPSGPAGTFFVFDPIGQPSGSWRVYLTATTDTGQVEERHINFTVDGGVLANLPSRDPSKPQAPRQNPGRTGDDIILHSGEFVFSERDLAIAARGLSFALDRTYRSQLNNDGPLGFGWSFTFGQRLYPQENQSVLVLEGDGLLTTYTYDAGNSTYTASSGSYSILTKHENGSYTIQDRGGLKRHFNSDGNITSFEERGGHSVACEYDAQKRLIRVRDSIGRPIDFTYGDADRITTMTDFTGRVVSYQYDSAGNLTSATLPGTDAFPAGRTTTYTYSAATSGELSHNLVSITDPKGQTYLENTYSDDDRVTSQVFANGTFTWEYIPSDSRTIFTQRDGARCEYQFDGEGHVVRKTAFTQGLRPTDPSEYVYLYTYNPHGEVTRVQYPRGNEATFAYDESNADRLSQGNLLESREKAGSLGTDPDLVTTYTYEPRFQQVKTIVDARGNHPSFGPQSKYQTTCLYDYEEGEAGLNQDLNGDGRQDQSRGNLIKIEHPATTVVDAAGSATGTNSSFETFAYDDHSQLIRHRLTNGTVNQYEYFPAATIPGDPDSREGYVQRMVRDVGGIAASVSFERDNLGRATSMTDPNGHTRMMEYSPTCRQRPNTAGIRWESRVTTAGAKVDDPRALLQRI